MRQPAREVECGTSAYPLRPVDAGNQLPPGAQPEYEL